MADENLDRALELYEQRHKIAVEHKKQLFAKMCEITSLVTSVKTVSNFIIVVFRKIPSKDSIKIRDLMCNEIGRIEEKNYVFFKEIADNRQWVFVSKSQTEEVI